MRKYFKFLKDIKIRYASKTEIIVFEKTNIEYLNTLVNDYSIIVLNKVPGDYFININILFSTLKRLLHPKFIKENRGSSLINTFNKAYYMTFILNQKPKAVLTSIDNHPIFNFLSFSIKNIPFIAIQNGIRHPYESGLRNYNVQHFFSFGENEKKYFNKKNYKVSNFYPSGSFIGSFHLDFKKDFEIEYDILIVSCWRGNIGYNQEVIDSMNSMKKFDSMMSKFISKRKLKVAIILRNEEKGEHFFMPQIGLTEEQYFRNNYSNIAEIIHVDFKKRNIYDLIAKSNLIISSYGTTVLLEAYGIGKKILYVFFTEKEKYYEIFDESILCVNPNQELFNKKLDEIISIKNMLYNKTHKQNMEYYMKKNGVETQNFIRNEIKKIIQNQKSFNL